MLYVVMAEQPEKLLAGQLEQNGRGFFTTVISLLTHPNWHIRKAATDALTAKLSVALAEQLVRAFFVFMFGLSGGKSAAQPSMTALSMTLHSISRPLTSAVVKGDSWSPALPQLLLLAHHPFIVSVDKPAHLWAHCIAKVDESVDMVTGTNGLQGTSEEFARAAAAVAVTAVRKSAESDFTSHLLRRLAESVSNPDALAVTEYDLGVLKTPEGTPFGK